jgi:hypothetical protein
MRWLVFALIALTGLVGAAYAVAGPPGGRGAEAFALVNPNNGSPLLVSAQTSGFTGVSVGLAGPGDYCLTPSAGVNVDTTAAVASQEAFYSEAFGFVTVRYEPGGPNCGPNQLEVKTFADDRSGLSTQVAFTVNVP